jgi:hypothetical protein
MLMIYRRHSDDQNNANTEQATTIYLIQLNPIGQVQLQDCQWQIKLLLRETECWNSVLQVSISILQSRMQHYFL